MPKCLAAGAPPDPAGGAHDAPPDFLISWGERHPSPFLTPSAPSTPPFSLSALSFCGPQCKILATPLDTTATVRHCSLNTDTRYSGKMLCFSTWLKHPFLIITVVIIVCIINIMVHYHQKCYHVKRNSLNDNSDATLSCVQFYNLRISTFSIFRLREVFSVTGTGTNWSTGRDVADAWFLFVYLQNNIESFFTHLGNLASIFQQLASRPGCYR